MLLISKNIDYRTDENDLSAVYLSHILNDLRKNMTPESTHMFLSIFIQI